MIDIHTHILPGIDDGARDISDTLEMARIAVENGVTNMIATPHCNLPNRYDNYFDHEYRKVFIWAKEAIEEEGIPLQLHPGMEIYTTEEVPQLFRNGSLMTLNGSHYLLMEFSFTEDPEFANRMLVETSKLGVIPVVAHIERYHFVQAYPQIAKLWRDRGYVIQCNKGSYQGRFGEEEQKLAYKLLNWHLVDVIASDTHRPNVRTPNMRDVYDLLAQKYPAEYLKVLFHDNPMRILTDRVVPHNK